MKNKLSLLTFLLVTPVGIYFAMKDFYVYVKKADLLWFSSHFFANPTVQHKIGELLMMVAIISLCILLQLKLKQLFNRIFGLATIAIVAGGLLNLLAWKEIRLNQDWHLWCLILFASSLLVPYLLSYRAKKDFC